MKAVILAAGIGSRLAPLTNDRPKVLVEILGRSFLFRQLDLLTRVDRFTSLLQHAGVQLIGYSALRDVQRANAG